MSAFNDQKHLTDEEMKALLLHCKEYRVKVGRKSNRPKGITPEELRTKAESVEDCIVALVTAEKGDDVAKVSSDLASEISKMSREIYNKNIVILPFAHLSNKLSDPKDALAEMKLTEGHLKEKFRVTRAHFGSHKELLLHLYGHPGNVRYREF